MDTNVLYYGDNLEILRKYIPDESIDLIYLDPPFNSKATYNILYKELTGQPSQAQITAFEDTWQWGIESETALSKIASSPIAPQATKEFMSVLPNFVGKKTPMRAYITMMCVRLIELKRVLKDTGSIYLHCDPVASHYLKILQDVIFGAQNFRDEIVWKRADTVKGNFGQGINFFDRNTDSILFYAKSANNKFYSIFKNYTQDYLDSFYKFVEPDTGRRYRLISMTGPGGAGKGNPQYEVMGVTRYWRYSQDRMQQLIDAGMVVQTKPKAVPQRKQYLDEGKGVAVQSLWDDIPALHSQSGERLGYPTQKPLELLERIIKSATNEGDIVLDPFCGCGTAIIASQELNRQWIGIDVTHLAISTMKYRFDKIFPSLKYTVIGEPKDLESAKALFEQDKYQFQWWAVSLIKLAQPYGGKKKGADTGIDGFLYFQDEIDKIKKAIISVKGGHVTVSQVRDLIGVVQREKAEMGLFLTLEPFTKPMEQEAVLAGFYESPLGKNYPKIQILTIEDLLSGAKPDTPSWVSPIATPKVHREKKGKSPKLL